MCDYCDELQEALTQLNSDLDDTEQALDQYKDKVAKGEDELADVQEKLDDLKSEYEDLEIERDEIKVERDQWKRELEGCDEDFEALQKDRDDWKHQTELVRVDAKVLVIRLEVKQKLHNETIAKLPRTADDATIFPGMTVYKMVKSPTGMWEAEHHTVEMGAESLNVTKTPFGECYSHPQIGIDAKEGR